MQDGLKQLGQSWDRLGRRAGQEWVQVGSRMDEFGHKLDHNIRRGFTNFGNFDMFGKTGDIIKENDNSSYLICSPS